MIIRDDGMQFSDPHVAAHSMLVRPQSTFTLNGQDVTEHVVRVANRIVEQHRLRQDIANTGLYE